MFTSSASHNRAALSATASSTGWSSVGELLITRRIPAVAACCSSASVKERLRLSTASLSSAYVGSAPHVSGVPHVRQNLACGGFTCSHRVHLMPEPPHVRSEQRHGGGPESSPSGMACLCC